MIEFVTRKILKTVNAIKISQLATDRFATVIFLLNYSAVKYS